MPKPPFQLFAVVPPGLEAVAAAELAAAGERPEVAHGGLSWDSGWSGLIAAHLHSRIASRVLVRIARFGARALGELERKAAQVEWDAWIPPERRQPRQPPIELEVSCRRSRLYHEGAVRERVLAALGWSKGAGPRRVDDDQWRLHVRVHRDTVTLSLDATGPHLHRRGYRRLTGAAPLRETLAAAALRASGWRVEEPLIDPFAGSGTIPIEAALIARRIPPGLAGADREPARFPFLSWTGMPTSRWTDEVDRARAAILPRAPAPILASDRDSRAIEALKGNAEVAGVLSDLDVHLLPMNRSGDAQSGWIVTNPPYGGRLGDRKQLRPLYRAIGARLADDWRGRGFCAWIGDRALAGVLRRELARRGGGPLEDVLETRNGGIPVTLVRRAVPRPPDPPADR